MKVEISLLRKASGKLKKSGFTLMETVIAILVLAILLTGFLTVFTPAAQGIRKSISTQQADRLASSLVRDMAKLNKKEAEDTLSTLKTGFDKAFTWINDSDSSDRAILVYQYRGDKNEALRDDGTVPPMARIEGKPGIDYTVQSAARRMGDDDEKLQADLEAAVGPIFYVKLTQLYPENDQLRLGNIGDIVYLNESNEKTVANNPADYPDAIITFSAAFYRIPAASVNYLNSNGFSEKFDSNAKPIFVRNLAVRR